MTGATWFSRSTPSPKTEVTTEMALPAPNLDDRRFQELVDEAKRMVMQRCPEWTDHNVSDPGVTLIETFAYMTDLMLYRLNRVPERLYVKFLELIGLRLFPPTAARADVTFWLTTPAEGPLIIPPATNAATLRSEHEEPVVFSTIEPLSIMGCSLLAVGSELVDGGAFVDQTDRLQLRASFGAFSPVPIAGDALLIALSEAVPRCAVMLQFDCSVEGIGVDPTNPPLVWEAWTGDTWDRCEVDRDETGGLNRAGAVVVHVPPTHRPAVRADRRAGWLRARVRPSEPGEPSYTSSPVIRALQASTVGGTIGAVRSVRRRARQPSDSRPTGRRSCAPASRCKCMSPRKPVGRSGPKSSTSPAAGPTIATSSSIR
jgi:predicted phage baseplate assembly protein